MADDPFGSIWDSGGLGDVFCLGEEQELATSNRMENDDVFDTQASEFLEPTGDSITCAEDVRLFLIFNLDTTNSLLRSN